MGNFYDDDFGSRTLCLALLVPLRFLSVVANVDKRVLFMSKQVVETIRTLTAVLGSI